MKVSIMVGIKISIKVSKVKYKVLWTGWEGSCRCLPAAGGEGGYTDNLRDAHGSTDTGTT